MMASRACAVQILLVAFSRADMLFPGLHGHAQGALTPAVDGDADDTAGGGALIGVTGGEKCRMRSTETHRYAKPLTVAHHHIPHPSLRET